MSTLQSRKISTIIGAFVADAAAQPLHWMYNAADLLELTGLKQDVEFHDPPGNPFYRIETGRNSCYGDQIYVLLKSLIKHKGYIKQDYIEQTYKFFGPESEYDHNETVTITAEKLYAENGPKAPNSVHCDSTAMDTTQIDEMTQTAPVSVAEEHSSAISGPWKHTSLKHFEANYTAGEEETGSETDIAIDCVVRVIPLVALYAGKTELLEVVEDAVSVTQRNDVAVAVALAAARVLEYIILQGKVDGVLERVIKDLRDSKRLCPTDLDNVLASKLQDVLDVRLEKHTKVARENFKIS